MLLSKRRWHQKHFKSAIGIAQCSMTMRKIIPEENMWLVGRYLEILEFSSPSRAGWFVQWLSPCHDTRIPTAPSGHTERHPCQTKPPLLRWLSDRTVLAPHLLSTQYRQSSHDRIRWHFPFTAFSTIIPTIHPYYCLTIIVYAPKMGYNSDIHAFYFEPQWWQCIFATLLVDEWLV